MLEKDARKKRQNRRGLDQEVKELSKVVGVRSEGSAGSQFFRTGLKRRRRRPGAHRTRGGKKGIQT